MYPDSFTEGHRARLRRRYLRGGAESLLSYEVLELILMYAVPRKDVKPLAKTLIQHFGSFRNVLNAAPEELERVSGIGQSSAILISLFKPVCLMYLRETLEKTPAKLSGENLREYLCMLFDRSNREMCAVLLYDSAGKLITAKVWDGVESCVQLPMQDVVLYAISNKANMVVLAHNHPSGNLEFSANDINATEQLFSALNIFDVVLYDHILVCGNKLHSWRNGD